jgi:glucan phosphoethanolaminetransferase (alkaline phosphatase superfamily)
MACRQRKLEAGKKCGAHCNGHPSSQVRHALSAALTQIFSKHGMDIIKKYFFTITALGIALLIVSLSFLQGQLAYLNQLQHGADIVKLINKADQVSFLLVIGTLLAMVIIVLVFQKPQRSKTLSIGFAAVFLLTLLAKGKFDNMGTDSIAEVLHTNAQEAKDFAGAHLTLINVTLKECLVLLAPLLLIPVYRFVVRDGHGAAQWRDMQQAFKLIACVYLFTIAGFIYQLATNYHSLDYFKNRLDGSTAQTLPHLEKRRAAPNVVVYIGESTSKENLPIYANHGALPDPLKEIKNDLIVYSDVITSFSHTFPSLYRAFSLSKDPYLDQFQLVKDVRRANSVATLNHFGLETYWISNQGFGGSWDWNSELFGKHASHTQILSSQQVKGQFKEIRKTDRALLKAYKQYSANLAKANQMIFLHSYAGHGDYCKNIPQEERRPPVPAVPPLSQKAVFGDAYIGDLDQRIDDIDCYNSAMSFISKNIRTVIDDVARQQAPVVFLYFADHGEEVFEGTGHDSRKNSFRHIEIPFLVYFNEAAKKAYPDLYRAAVANKDKPYSIEWLTDSLLDLAGIASKERDLVSVFREGNQAPKRYALRRTDIRGNQFILAVDDEDASSKYALLNQGHDYYRMRRIYNTFPPAEKNKICSYRTNSLMKYREAARLFDCIEVDITIDAASGNLFAYRPPQENNHLKLEDLIRFGPPIPGQLLLSVSNPGNKNLTVLHEGLNRLFGKQHRDRVVIEIAHFDNVDSSLLRRLGNDGYKLFYALPNELGKQCAKDKTDGTCRRFRERTLPAIEQAGVRGIAFDIDAFPFVTSLHAHGRLEYNVKDLSVKSTNDIDSAMLAQSHSYSIPYNSAFDY